MRLEQWGHDLRVGARRLVRAPVFTVPVVLTLTVGIAGTTAMFALISGVLLRPLSFRDQGRLVVAWTESPVAGDSHWPLQTTDIDVIRDETRTLESVAGISYYGVFSLAEANEERAGLIGTTGVTGDFFRVVDLEPILGRVLDPSDEGPGTENVLVITRALWRARFGASPEVIGRRLILNGQPFTIVGVVPHALEYPPGVEAWTTPRAVASTLSKEAFRDGVQRQVDLIARLREAVTIEQARSELQALASRLEKDAPREAPRGFQAVVHPLESVVVGDVRRPMIILFAAVVLVLLIAAANVANLLLLRGLARRTEMALRTALGATPGGLARQLIAESLLLALVGGACGLVVAAWVLRAVLALLPEGFPRIDAVHLDAVVVVFALSTTLLTVVLASIPSILRSRRVDLVTHLGSGRRVGEGLHHGRRVLVALQIALAVVVVTTAGLLTRSLLRLQALELGVDADRLAVVHLVLPPAYEDAERHLQFLKEVTDRLEAAPGIERVTPVNTPPFAEYGWDLPAFTAEGQSPERAQANPSLNLEAVHPGYFATLGVGLVRGRAFEATDRGDSPRVAIVSEDVAARTWPGEDPIGKRLKLGAPDSNEEWRTVVGVVRPTRYRELAAPPPTLYLPAEQFIVAAPFLVLRTSSPLALVAAAAREGVRAADPAVQVSSVAPFAQRLAGRLARPRFRAFLIGFFGLAALLLSAIGLYAVMGAQVRERYPELGIRVALGARRSDLRRLVLGEGLRLAGVGAVLGLGAAVAVARLLRGLLFDVRPLDPLSLLGATVLLVGVSALASYLPARRATEVDPGSLLRAL
jgi:putative ABC transport system permease protein